MQHYQPRIVIDFDAEDGEGQEAPQAGSGTVSGAVGATSGKPADLLRSIQNMRLTLKRLEQQKQQHAASVAAAPGAGATASIVVLDKQASLQAQVSCGTAAVDVLLRGNPAAMLHAAPLVCLPSKHLMRQL